MCLLVVLTRMHAEFPLVVAANRDEVLDRPATPMSILREDAPRVVGGRDDLAGGTWLAVNQYGVVAGLTNRPRLGGRDLSKRSRGELPLALATHASATSAIQAFASRFKPAHYNAAWLIVADRVNAFSIDMTGVDRAVIEPLDPGLYILENRPLGAPSTKVDHVRGLLGRLEDLRPDRLVQQLQVVLGDHEVPSGPSAADEVGVADVPDQVKSACVHTERYGTRWSGVITVPHGVKEPPTVRYTDGPACQRNYARADVMWSCQP